jgi:hypothetical protein
VAAIGPNAQQLLDNNEVRATARPGSGSAGYRDADEADRQSIGGIPPDQNGTPPPAEASPSRSPRARQIRTERQLAMGKLVFLSISLGGGRAPCQRDARSLPLPI